MSRLLFAVRKYWYVPIVLLLVFNSWYMVLSIMRSSSGYAMFSKLSEIAPQITMQRQLTKWMGTKEESNKISIAEGEYFGTYRGFLLSMNASNLVSIAIGDSVFNPYHPRYPYIYSIYKRIS